MTQRIITIGLSLGVKVKWIPTLDYTGQLAKAASVGIKDSGLGLQMLSCMPSVLLQVCTCMFVLSCMQIR